MRSTRSFAQSRPPSYAERLDAHWSALSPRRKAQIVFYLGRRLGREVRRKAPHLAKAFGKSIVVAACEVVRDVQDVVCTLTLTGMRTWRELRRVDWRELYTSAAPSAATALVLVLLLALFAPSPEETDRRREAFLEKVRIASVNPPPPCVSDGDGGIWIDVGREYVRPRDPEYAKLRRELCGF
ncbi:MAG: hypothetical protein AB7T59_01445 [Hyphomonadaceae bacterium]